MTKQSLFEVTATNTIDLNDITASQFVALLDNLDIKMHLQDYIDNAVAMHVIICFDVTDSMYTVLFIHVSSDDSSYCASIIEVTSSLKDAVTAMTEQLRVDYENYD